MFLGYCTDTHFLDRHKIDVSLYEGESLGRSTSHIVCRDWNPSVSGQWFGCVQKRRNWTGMNGNIHVTVNAKLPPIKEFGCIGVYKFKVLCLDSNTLHR